MLPCAMQAAAQPLTSRGLHKRAPQTGQSSMNQQSPPRPQMRGRGCHCGCTWACRCTPMPSVPLSAGEIEVAKLLALAACDTVELLSKGGLCCISYCGLHARCMPCLGPVACAHSALYQQLSMLVEVLSCPPPLPRQGCPDSEPLRGVRA